MSIRSMTGFARVRRVTDDGELAVSIKALNHRGLDIHFHMSAEFDSVESAMRGYLKKHIARGHIDVRVNWTRSKGANALAVNRDLLNAYLDLFKQVSEENGLTGQPDLNQAFRLPGMFTESNPENPRPQIEEILLDALTEATTSLNTFREREAAELIEVIRHRNQAIRVSATRMEQVRLRALPAFHARLLERLTELLRSANIDPQRLAQEVAILTDRSDITEELARVQIHCSALDKLLAGGDEVGKKMDFLMQEMNREANTILSKTTGIGETGLGITETALVTKAEIEKVREQALNLE